MNQETTSGFNNGWTTRDIMVTAILSIVMGIIYIPLTYISGYLMAVPVLRGFGFGLNLLPILLVAYLIRKPGVAIFSSLVAFLVIVPLTPWGILMLISAFTAGLPIELFLLARRYKNFNTWYLMLTGAITSAFNAILLFMMEGLGNVSLWIQVSYLIATLLGGAILGGLIAKILGDAVLKTGVLSVKT